MVDKIEKEKQNKPIKSTISGNFLTVIPKAIRNQLGFKKGDTLLWAIQDGKTARVIRGEIGAAKENSTLKEVKEAPKAAKIVKEPVKEPAKETKEVKEAVKIEAKAVA